MNNVLHGWNMNNIKISPGYTTVHAVTNYLIFYTNLYSIFFFLKKAVASSFCVNHSI